MILVGDPPYYGPLGFEKVAWNALAFPGPVDPARVLVMPFADDTHERLKGVIAWRECQWKEPASEDETETEALKIAS